MEIVPAVIVKSFRELEFKAQFVKDVLSQIEIDVCDGGFVKDLSWPIEDKYGDFKNLVNEKIGLPFWEDLDYNIHLMTRTPEDEVADWAKAGAYRIFVHIESAGDNFLNILDEWGSVVEIGLAVKMDTPIESLTSYFSKVSAIQLMSIDIIGLQGQKFDKKIFDRVQKIRDLGFQKRLSIDGGVDLEQAEKLKKAGVDAVVVGSKIWENDNPNEAMRNFNDL
jgi:ribulose-phosphate 3-epimerase